MPIEDHSLVTQESALGELRDNTDFHLLLRLISPVGFKGSLSLLSIVFILPGNLFANGGCSALACNPQVQAGAGGAGGGGGHEKDESLEVPPSWHLPEFDVLDVLGSSRVAKTKSWD